MKKTLGAIIILVLAVIVGLKLFNRSSRVSARVVTIKSRNLDYQVLTSAQTVAEVLADQGFTLTFNSSPVQGEETAPTPSPLAGEGGGEGVVNGMTIEISPSVQVRLIDGGNEKTITTTVATVNDLLYEQNIGLAATDRVTPSLGSFLGEGLNVTIDRIVDVEVTEQRIIPFEIRQEHDPSIYYGQELVVSAGKEGNKEQQFLITYKNGVEIKRKKLAEKILEKPVTELRRFGTRIEVEREELGRASWYAYKGCICAAHPFYDKGRFVKVTSVASGKSIIVRINDRGPELDKHPDRVIDLDSTAYKQLAPLGSGTIEVEVELLKQ